MNNEEISESLKNALNEGFTQIQLNEHSRLFKL